MPWSGEWGVPLVPAEASGYRVYRSSSDPNTWMVVTADTGWSGTRLGAWAGCHGEGFQADVRDGWNTIASRSGTCVGGAGGLLAPALSVAFFAAAGILVIVAWRKSPRFRV